jgi:anti-sigma B factor antagonist
MNHNSFSDNDNTTVLRVEGELDALSSAELRPTVDELTRGEGRKIRVDLSELNLLDSSGAGCLVALYTRARANGGSVTFVGVVDQPLAIFKLLRLDRVFDLAA